MKQGYGVLGSEVSACRVSREETVSPFLCVQPLPSTGRPWLGLRAALDRALSETALGSPPRLTVHGRVPLPTLTPFPPSAGRVSLHEVQLTSARPGLSSPTPWVEDCVCPQGYVGQFCDSCAPGFKREAPFGGPFSSCIPCTCNQHGSCDPNTGLRSLPVTCLSHCVISPSFAGNHPGHLFIPWLPN